MKTWLTSVIGVIGELIYFLDQISLMTNDLSWEIVHAPHEGQN